MEQMIVRMVRNIRRNRSAEQCVDATGRMKYGDLSVIPTMPVGDGPEEVELTYFRLGRGVTDDELVREYEIRDLIPDPQAQCTDNEADPAFADEHPNDTHWEIKKGVWGYIGLGRCNDVRRVRCDCNTDFYGWGAWFAGRHRS